MASAFQRKKPHGLRRMLVGIIGGTVEVTFQYGIGGAAHRALLREFARISTFREVLSIAATFRERFNQTGSLRFASTMGAT